jgi:hypothetical protein
MRRPKPPSSSSKEPSSPAAYRGQNRRASLGASGVSLEGCISQKNRLLTRAAQQIARATGPRP